MSIYQCLGFNHILTLHAIVGPAQFPEMQGTRFELKGKSIGKDIEEAKSKFLAFSPGPTWRIAAKTKFGDIINGSSPASIFIKGLKVAEEPTFRFSYVKLPCVCFSFLVYVFLCIHFLILLLLLIIYYR